LLKSTHSSAKSSNKSASNMPHTTCCSNQNNAHITLMVKTLLLTKKTQVGPVMLGLTINSSCSSTCSTRRAM